MCKTFVPMASKSSIIYIIFVNLLFTGYQVRGGSNNLKYNISWPHSNTVSKIESLYGDIYDCVDVYKQHSLTHPALRGHKIKMRPSQQLLDSLMKNMTNPSNSTPTELSFSPKKLWKLGKGCPKGTVPIQRTIHEYDHSKDNNNFSHSLWTHGVEFAGIRSKPGMTFRGASAIINIQNPQKVGADEYSAAMISIESGPNQIQAGWIVDPKLYGDYRTRLYTSWTRDNHFKTGCHNTLCKGFVMVNNKIPLGFVFKDISVSEGKQFEFYFYIFLEPGVGWWLYVHDWFHPVGYWPLSLFTSTMQQKATSVRFGGEVFTPNSEDNSPQMGSGKFKNGQYDKTCYMRQVDVNISGEKTITNADNSYMNKVESRCYFVGDNSYKKQKQEYSFVFGGMGGKDEERCVY